MFSNLSRYRKLPDEVLADADDRLLAAKELRILPVVSGQLKHTVAEGDRLDHLAFTYYRQPRKWWRICDANPEVLSPQALLGKEPSVAYRFPLIVTGTEEPPLALLLAALGKRFGVETASLTDDDRGVVVHFNRLNVTAVELADAIDTIGQDAGFVAGHPQRIDRVGKTIVVPPDVTT